MDIGNIIIGVGVLGLASAANNYVDFLISSGVV
ncbi:TMhelix containing protein [Vibrio phage 409E50-1]|nr:TMhelix containing protein [Vibrio phage 464E53-1]CAH9011959.1 TMhelix containing protein [Vibrio phage 521E56-1]CAH9012089.1 TMhelix containing protein [Vibrio phage 384E50-1]CAH9012114.1 TMhelix containing protein [Vibrio phage 402E50-1]CAH9012118.1 TMhelix containing protein [Vibrio phage 409E50-1]CAH9013343.1 TMhelix containing protein [Vibrio phage 405E50-1]CAH9013398.1 TMhelix containing protein [Vibrio phage 413E50-1]CAH9015259.1 TMhelix containing protein [Vibrio phage 468E53-1]